MNILFFLKPKQEVAYIEDNDTLRQALEKMEYHKYAAIPILSKDGAYVGTITEGDLLWHCKANMIRDEKAAESATITAIPRRAHYHPVSANSNMEDLISLAMNQNFVPVTDDENRFIGIITRRDLINYTYTKLKELSNEQDND